MSRPESPFQIFALSGNVWDMHIMLIANHAEENSKSCCSTLKLTANELQTAWIRWENPRQRFTFKAKKKEESNFIFAAFVKWLLTHPSSAVCFSEQRHFIAHFQPHAAGNNNDTWGNGTFLGQGHLTPFHITSFLQPLHLHAAPTHIYFKSHNKG